MLISKRTIQWYEILERRQQLIDITVVCKIITVRVKVRFMNTLE